VQPLQPQGLPVLHQEQQAHFNGARHNLQGLLWRLGQAEKARAGMKTIKGADYPELSCNAYWLDGLAIDCGPLTHFPHEPELILLTHGHYDHCGGVRSRALLHEADWDVKWLNEQFRNFERPSQIGRLRKKNFEWVDWVLKVIETPGHTPGSVCFFDEEKRVLFSGDTLFADGFGRTDLNGGNPEKMAESLELVESLNWKTLYPGHGPAMHR